MKEEDTKYDITVHYNDGTMVRFRDADPVDFRHGILIIKKWSLTTNINIDKIKFWTGKVEA